MTETSNPARHATALGAAALAFLAGSAGSWAAALAVLFMPPNGAYIIAIGAITGVPVVVAWSFGMLLVGYPAWLLAHLTGLRRLGTAVIIGTVMAGAGCIGLGLVFGVPAEPDSLATLFALGGAGGACAGATIWYWAYRRGRLA